MTFPALLNVSFDGNRPDEGGGRDRSVSGPGPGPGPGQGPGVVDGAPAGCPANGTAAPSELTAQAVGVGLFLACFILFAVAGNVLVILSVACNRHLHTVTNYFIVNLAVADLLLSAAVLPFSATLEVLGFWAFGRAFCTVWAAVDVLCCTASILSLCVISVDRYIGVKHSLRYPAIMTERKAALILTLLWAASVVISVGPLLGWKEPQPSSDTVCTITEEAGYAVFSSICSFYLPMAVILAMYFRVYVVARRTTRSLEAGVKKERGKSAGVVVLRIHCRSALDAPHAGPGPGVGTGPTTGPGTGSKGPKGPTFRSSLSIRMLKFSREKKAAKTLAIVVGVFVLCWFPFFFILPLGSLFPALKPSELLFKVIFWLGYFNSCVNPIIYPCSSKEFKRAFIRLLRCQCGHRHRHRPIWRVYDGHWGTQVGSSRWESGLDPRPHGGDPNPTPALLPTPGLTPAPTGPDPGAGGGRRRPRPFREWKIFSSFRRPSSQLREKVTSLSHKIRSGSQKGAAAFKTEVESVSIGIPQDPGEVADFQPYNPADRCGLRETDI
ncbi:alpha-1D adrenergic receptor [Tachyglossus aculeatus]|uniref:alpha-1D adrenergic receptor n=1 Tax=Tachyglossus aculeatus TaxID=9261 RepID=UPI0018F5A0FF|nr:alpha-1D adrenergic receptor [Tachyglossus aculeatus]XP_038608552.1 alpha-1D adrenergic receptor [Tachyglossus aculeatus]